MTIKKSEKPVNKSPYKASLTREQFLYYEMRTTAKLYCAGLNDEQIIERIFSENLYQYPTEKSIRSIAIGCISRLKAINDDTLANAIATQPSDVAKQICLYALMKHHRIVWDFMISVIGEKYRSMDTSFSRMDVNTFFMRLQEQDDTVASWSDTTVEKIKSVLIGILVENGYLSSHRSTTLNPVLLSRILENAIRSNNDDIALPAFNCLT